MAVELLDRLLGLGVPAHLDEAEATRLAGIAVGDDGHGLAGSRGGEEIFEIPLRRTEGEVANVQFLTHLMFLLFRRASRAARVTSPKAYEAFAWWCSGWSLVCLSE